MSTSFLIRKKKKTGEWNSLEPAVFCLADDGGGMVALGSTPDWLGNAFGGQWHSEDGTLEVMPFSALDSFVCDIKTRMSTACPVDGVSLFFEESAQDGASFHGRVTACQLRAGKGNGGGEIVFVLQLSDELDQLARKEVQALRGRALRDGSAGVYTNKGVGDDGFLHAVLPETAGEDMLCLPSVSQEGMVQHHTPLRWREAALDCLSRGIDAPVILVVEREEWLRNLVRALFQRNGYRTVAVPDPAGVLDVLENGRHEVVAVVTGASVPAWSSRELVQALQRNQVDIPVISSCEWMPSNGWNAAGETRSSAIFPRPDSLQMFYERVLLQAPQLRKC